MIFLVADTHFYHENIIKFCNRPFKNVDEMNQYMIDKWNQSVGPEDTVFHLGDVILCKKNLLSDIVGQLNGHKTLLRGNHDRDISDEAFISAGFEHVYADSYRRGNVIMSHYPLEITTPGNLNIHGHIHNTPPDAQYPFYCSKQNFCVSVEMIGYGPIALRQIFKEVA